MRHWYEQTILHSAWQLPPERFTSQAFWDCFESILPIDGLPEQAGDNGPLTLAPADPLDQAQSRLLALWKQRYPASRRLLAYDTTNFYTMRFQVLAPLYRLHQRPRRFGATREKQARPP